MTRSICTVDGCDAPIVCRGYCSRHHQRWLKYGDPSVVKVRRSRRAWTSNELAELEDLIGSGWSDARLAKRFNCTVNGIQLARKRHGIPSRTAVLLSGHSVAARLGIGCGKSVARWIQQGWLKGRRGQPRGGGRQWHVTEDALLAFLEGPAHWHRWDPARIPDRDLREWAEDLRAGVRFLTQAEVARRYFVERKTVQQWIDKGWLPGYDTGSHRMLREDDLVGWIPPSQLRRDKLARLERQAGVDWLDLPAPAPFRRVRILRRAA